MSNVPPSATGRPPYNAPGSTDYRDDVRGWNRRYWLEIGYSREQIRNMDPAEAGYEIAFAMRWWDDVERMQNDGQHGFSYGPELA